MITYGLKQQKKIALLGIVLILFPSFFFMQPKKAEALVPTADPVNWAINTAIKVATLAIKAIEYITSKATYALWVKEYFLDPILWVFVKAIIKSLMDSIIEWVRTGFNGNPLFITDLGQVLRDAGVEASGAFIEEYLSEDMKKLLCDPWYFNIGFSLNLYRNSLYGKKHYECTIDDIIRNIEGFQRFMADFRYGGWPAWFSLFEKPTNNAYGLYFSQIVEMENRMYSAQKNTETESVFNQGFLSVKKCVQCTTVDPNTGDCIYCAKWKTESPGSWIQDQISLHTGTEIRTLELADEFNELLGALLGQLWNWMTGGLGGGLSGGYSGTSYTTNYTPNYPIMPYPEDGIMVDPSEGIVPGTGTGTGTGTEGPTVTVRRAGDFRNSEVFPGRAAATLVSASGNTIYYTVNNTTPTTNSPKYMKAEYLADDYPPIKFITVNNSGQQSAVQSYTLSSQTPVVDLNPPIIENIKASIVNYGGKEWFELDPTGARDPDSSNYIAMYEWNFDPALPLHGNYDWWAADYNRDGTFEEIEENSTGTSPPFIETDIQRSEKAGVVRIRFTDQDRTGSEINVFLRVTDNEGLYTAKRIRVFRYNDNAVVNIGDITE